ncbi:pyridoxal-phosphate dependent enzyme, partial [Streptomyces sp. HNM0663]
ALNAAVEAGRLVDVTPDSVAADSLGARRASAAALHAAQQDRVHSVTVPDEEIIRARRALWDHRRLAVEHGAATALAALTAPIGGHPGRTLPEQVGVPSGGYRPQSGERVAVVLCGANTDPSDLAHKPEHFA